jgi:DNA polymerase
MDAREQLRRYLEQRRELGETELVLDQLSVEDVLKLVGAATGAKGALTPPADPATTTAPPGTLGAEQTSTDWREVLRDAGASPGQQTVPPRQPSDTPHAPPTAAKDAAEVKPAAFAGPSGMPPAGIVIGASEHDLFGTFGALDSLDAIARTVASCTRCPLYATATRPVPGEGNPRADLMVVGEAPGATEDEQGRPFVGAAGQLLTKILAAVNLNREDVFICNVLKHRPPGNRNPLPDEVTACSPYLFRQFELLQPKAILALGTFAAQTLLQTKLAIGKLRSQVHRFHGVPLIVTYHPAALLRNPSWKRPTWEDVQLVRRILDSSVAES